MLLLKMSTILRGTEFHFQILTCSMKVTYKVKMKSGFPASVIMNLVNMYMYM